MVLIVCDLFFIFSHFLKFWLQYLSNLDTQSLHMYRKKKIFRVVGIWEIWDKNDTFFFLVNMRNGVETSSWSGVYQTSKYILFFIGRSSVFLLLRITYCVWNIICKICLIKNYFFFHFIYLYFFKARLILPKFIML